MDLLGFKNELMIGMGDFGKNNILPGSFALLEPRKAQGEAFDHRLWRRP